MPPGRAGAERRSRWTSPAPHGLREPPALRPARAALRPCACPAARGRGACRPARPSVGPHALPGAQVDARRRRTGRPRSRSWRRRARRAGPRGGAPAPPASSLVSSRSAGGGGATTACVTAAATSSRPQPLSSSRPIAQRLQPVAAVDVRRRAGQERRHLVGRQVRRDAQQERSGRRSLRRGERRPLGAAGTRPGRSPSSPGACRPAARR